ncbi:DUF1810 domain-containing protein [Altericroceibacterium endophyticum]|uniref:DUF1810 family protein n=1 Tax=Altericroceibacterium endophyticum TaxID=1808508 RepID=A0A6I4T9J9_9SPHN|nr:DUF1810 domain-containing protein [Altericroceibacterium endophyticum]MXO66962.1 DUF1810 family protein [Altericroceibacterium endophyticum]
MADADTLNRFVEAQNQDFTYQRALSELTKGRKQSHWMWFIFPQIAGLGRSQMAQHYAIQNLAEAERYLSHPILGPRLRECTAAILSWAGRKTAVDILGHTDAMKLHSCMTLFHEVNTAPAPSTTDDFSQALTCFFDGVSDEATLARI